MMRAPFMAGLGLALLTAAPAHAASPAADAPWLPPVAAVNATLAQHPGVLAAQARLAGAQAQARVLRAGPHEFNLSTSYVRRSVDRAGRFDEYDATLTRAVRLPGKAGLDRKIGDHGVAVAENLLGDARHKAALLLADSWLEWLAASAEVAIDARAVQSYAKAHAVVSRRVELRDAAPVEADQAHTAMDAAQATYARSLGRAAQARAKLAVLFPDLPLPAEPPLPADPAAMSEGLGALRDLVVARSHEVGAAEAEAARAETAAARAARDRLADPTVGVRLFSERGGEEKGAGFVASIPLGGAGRRAVADQAAAAGQAAQAELAAMRAEVRLMADSDLAGAEHGLRAWRSSVGALESALMALERLRKGYHLGGSDLVDLLFSERQADDARRAELAARVDALRALTRLRIDAHELWMEAEAAHGVASATMGPQP